MIHSFVGCYTYVSSKLSRYFKQKKIISNYKNSSPVFPSIGINLQKQILEIKNYSLYSGGQLLFPSKLIDYEYYTYINNKYTLRNLKLIIGVFYGNNNYFGNESRLTQNYKNFGLQMGYEYEIIKDKFFLQSDFVSGYTSLSNLIIGGAYKFTKHLLFSTGFQIPNDNNNSEIGLIFELTLL